MNSQMHYEALTAPRPAPRVVEGWPPPTRRHPPPPRGRRVRRGVATGLVRVARRLDSRVA